MNGQSLKFGSLPSLPWLLFPIHSAKVISNVRDRRTNPFKEKTDNNTIRFNRSY